VIALTVGATKFLYHMAQALASRYAFVTAVNLATPHALAFMGLGGGGAVVTFTPARGLVHMAHNGTLEEFDEDRAGCSHNLVLVGDITGLMSITP